jgi:hypothetical protein
MRRVTVISCVALLGCASSGTTTGGATPQESVRISGGVGLPTTTLDTHPTTAASTTTVGFPLDRVWGALRVAYDSLAIPVSTADPASHTMGNSSLRIRRRLGTVAMSKYVNCGNVQGGPSADSYELVLSVVTRAEPADQGMTRLVTSVDAQGRPVTISAEYMRCTSTGGLEKRIAELVTAQLNR